jgi:hypothetical protein
LVEPARGSPWAVPIRICVKTKRFVHLQASSRPSRGGTGAERKARCGVVAHEAPSETFESHGRGSIRRLPCRYKRESAAENIVPRVRIPLAPPVLSRPNSPLACEPHRSAIATGFARKAPHCGRPPETQNSVSPAGWLQTSRLRGFSAELVSD